MLAKLSWILSNISDEINQEVVEASDILDKIQDNLANIQHNLAIIQEQRDNIKEMAQDLTYKYKVFEKQAQAQISQIQDIWQ